MTDDWNDEELRLFSKRWTCTSTVFYDPDRLHRLSDEISDWRAWARPVFKDMNFDVITVKHQKYTDIWRGSEAYKASFNLIEQTVLKQKHLEISICMCLGLGSFTGVHPKGFGDESRDRVLWQLVAFEGWVEQLRTRFDIQHVYFQDPRFSVLDRNFLISRGHDLTQISHPSERRWEEQLAAPARASRINILAAFMSQRALLHLPDPDIENYWRTCLYYKPDSVADIEPFEWEEKPEDCYTEEQAHEIWLSKGLITAEELEKMKAACWVCGKDCDMTDHEKIEEIIRASLVAKWMDVGPENKL
ncbi:high-affinity methionine permease [Physcia stellaris]|nr:high-affinity methionine permease [Physcia stellaris]